MNGAFLLRKQALCHQSPSSRLTRSIQGGPELPGSMQCSITETGAEVRFLGVLEILLPLNKSRTALKASGSCCMPPVLYGYSGAYIEASAPLDFHSSYRAEQGELPTRNWKPKFYFEKTHFHRRSKQAVTKSPETTMLFRYL